MMTSTTQTSLLDLIRNISWKKEVKEVFLISLIGIPWGFITCPDCNNKLWPIGISAFIWVVLWKGNTITSCLIDLKYDWLKKPVHRLIAGILGHTIFTALAILGTYYLFLLIFDIHLGNIQFTILVAIGITFVISLFMHSRSFLISWRLLAIDSERMKKEAISSRYEALKNQVNPHFLFNSLNALTNLVYEDQDQAVKFIKNLSKVYRYVLESKDKELVPLSDELKFLESFIYLQKIRHEDSLDVKSEITPHAHENVVPLALQMLMENAIKHNIISEDDPLEVRIFKENDFIYVENNIQLKNILKEDSAGVGLANIKARYEFLSDTPIEVNSNNGKFKVGIPIIKTK